MLLSTGAAFAATSTTYESEYAEEIGRALGEISGAKDSRSGEDYNYSDSMPDSTDISDMYDLDKQKSSYRSGFIADFKTGFQEGYNDAYDKAAYESTQVTLEQGLADGEAVGLIAGAAYGIKDFYLGNSLSYTRDMPFNTDIIEQYSLNNDYIDYENGFIQAFISAYEESYNQAYREANTKDGLEKETTEIIPISGGIVVTADNRFAMNVPSGTFYHDVSLSVITSYDVEETKYSNLIKASDSYTVKLSNLSGNVDESKSIDLAFEYYGDSTNGGIYKMNGTTWLYIPTVIEDGKMTATINPKILNSSGTIFSAFVDNSTQVFRDVRGHWANDEIDAYVRRGIINGYSDMTFKPDSNITRAEFLTLLSRVLNWNLYMYPGSTTTFKDADTFGYYTNIITYATLNKYINGYADGTFKPGNLISYAEVETIMKRVPYYQYFSWYGIATNMLYEKKTYSNSFNSMNNHITRAEVVYMLFSTTE